jgi:molybdopterin converting factor small subunit
VAATALFFGRLRDAAGGGKRSVAPLADATVAGLLDRLGSDDPRLAAALAAPDVRVALNRRLLARGERFDLAAGDEIAFMPPATGG